MTIVRARRECLRLSMNNLKLPPIFLFIGPLLAAVLGVYTVYTMDIPYSVFYPNFIGVLIGVPMVFFGWNLFHDKKLKRVMQLSAASVFLLLVCFIFPGPSDVHRWITFGSVSVNVSLVLVPAVLYCLHQFLHEKQILHGIILFAAVSMILGFQPDAGQATAFCLAGLVVFFYNHIDTKIKFASFAIAAAAITLAWLRVDLIEPVEYVEEIIYLISAFGPLGYLAIVVVSLFLFLPFIFLSLKRIETVRVLSISFIVYLATAFFITEFGHYPVPVMGAGFSSVVGWYMMLMFVYRPY